MKRLTIKNIGPVKNIEIDLNRINIFIGPQSSGKSTVAKIISFCQWLEKDCIANQSVKHIDAKFVNDKFIIYHDISSYLRLESFFHYQSEILDITYTTGIMIVNGMQKFDSAGLSKNAYIPSERNVISIPGVMNVKMPDNYILDFIDDWQVIRDKYKNGESLNLLDLDVKYSYDKETNEDRIVLKNGDSIPYSQASSGLQSLAPLCVYVDYITRWIYAHKEYESALQRQKLRDAMDRIIRLDDIDEWIKTHQKPYQYRIAELENRLSTIKATNVVIEEPEQNLFPKTQVNLLYYILSSLDHNRDHLVVTTHSPYILYALNNCILAYWVKKQGEFDIREFSSIPEEAILNPDMVSVWEISDGEILGNKRIQDNNGLIRKNFFDNVMGEVINDFSNLLGIADL